MSATHNGIHQPPRIRSGSTRVRQSRTHAGGRFRSVLDTGFPVLLALLGLLLVTSAAHAGQRIVNGVDSHDYPTTGAMLCSSSPINANNAQVCCSGTLIGCQTFLTASHCVDGDLNPSHYQVYLQHAGIFSVTAVTQHPQYVGAKFPLHDVAILKLATPVTGIAPTAVNTVDNPKNRGFGLPATIVGFGRTGGNSTDYGIKRAGLVQTAHCTQQTGGTDNTLVCWNFDSPLGSPGTNSNTCHGDSGGSLFMDLGTGTVAAGVTSGGGTNTCLPSDMSYDANVYAFRSYILGQLGSDPTSTCGGLAPVGDPAVRVVGNSGTLNANKPSDTLTVKVGSNVPALRFALNGEDNGTFDVNFYVKAGAGASPTTFDCKANGSSVFGACEFANPTAGTWSIYVERAAGSGQYQVTTTIFGGAPPVCGNNIAEFGEQCDGTDDASCPTLCASDCTCPAPVCGNDIVESGEQCDGIDPGTCPTGVCGTACQCPAPTCGNNILESGEQCDGTADSACPGACQTDCACPLTCTSDELWPVRIKAKPRRFRAVAWLDNYAGSYDSLDPRNGFTLSVTDGTSTVTADIPAADPGWAKSRPTRNRYVWKGDRNGIRRVRFIYRRRQLSWKVIVIGRVVPGADTLDVMQTLGVHLATDGICTDGTY